MRVAKLEDFIGTKLGNWTILAVDRPPKGEAVVTRQCKCGLVTKIDGKHVHRSKRCMDCFCTSRSEQYIGQKKGSFTALETLQHNRKRKLLVKCDCGKEQYMVPSQFNLLKPDSKCRQCRKKNHPGTQYEYITLIKQIDKKMWLVRCVCGKEFIKDQSHFAMSCGCKTAEKYLQRARDKIGTKIGFLTIKAVEKGDNAHNYYILKCKCGKTTRCTVGHEKKAKSCGCIRPLSIPRNEDKHEAKFRNYEIIAMRDLASSGDYSRKQLADMFEITPNYLCRILSRKIWKNLE